MSNLSNDSSTFVIIYSICPYTSWLNIISTTLESSFYLVPILTSFVTKYTKLITSWVKYNATSIKCFKALKCTIWHSQLPITDCCNKSFTSTAATKKKKKSKSLWLDKRQEKTFDEPSCFLFFAILKYGVYERTTYISGYVNTIWDTSVKRLLVGVAHTPRVIPILVATFRLYARWTRFMSASLVVDWKKPVFQNWTFILADHSLRFWSANIRFGSRWIRP